MLGDSNSRAGLFCEFRKLFLAKGLGTVFPYLVKTEEHQASSPGKTVGRLATINTIGAILGSLACDFLFLEVFGLWRAMQIIGVMYFLMALCMPSVRSCVGLAVKGVSGVGLLLWITLLNQAMLAVTGVLMTKRDEVTLKAWEGSDCTVSVVRGNEGLAVKINSDYGLSSTNGRVRLAMHAELPLMLKPDDLFVQWLPTYQLTESIST